MTLRVHAPLRIGPEIEVFRAIGDEDFLLWKTIKVAEFEDDLHSGLTIIDSKLTYGEDVYYQARSSKEDVVFKSGELSFQKEMGPKPPMNLQTEPLKNAIKIMWDAGDSFSHVIIYRRNIVEDSPIQKVSNLVAENFWIDDNVVPNGVYTYQVVAARLEKSALLYGMFSEPLYVTVENE